MINNEERERLPEIYQKNIDRAVEILKEAGCAKVFLFGSVAIGQITEQSDIDLAIRGCPKGEFFHLLGKLLFALDYPIDLVNLDSQDAFARHLEEKGELRQIG